MDTFDPKLGEYAEAEVVAFKEADGTEHKVMISARQGHGESEVTEFRPYHRQHKSEVEELFGEESKAKGMPSISDPGGPLRQKTTKLREYICEAFLPGKSGEKIHLMSIEAPGAKEALEQCVKGSSVQRRITNLATNRNAVISARIDSILTLNPEDQVKAMRELRRQVEMEGFYEDKTSDLIKAPPAKIVERWVQKKKTNDERIAKLNEMINTLTGKAALLDAATDIPAGARETLRLAKEMKAEILRENEEKELGYASVLHNMLGERETIIEMIRQNKRRVSDIDTLKEKYKDDPDKIRDLDIERDVYVDRISLLKRALDPKNKDARRELETEQSMIAPERPKGPTKRRYTPGEEEYDVPPEEEEGEKELKPDQQKYLNLMIEKAKAQAELASYERRVRDKGTQGIIDNRLRDEINNLEQKIAEFDQRLNDLESSFGSLGSDKKFTSLVNQRVYLELMREKADYERQLAKRQTELSSIEGKDILSEEAEENLRKVIEDIERNIGGIDDKLKDPDLKNLRRNKKFMSFVNHAVNERSYKAEKRSLEKIRDRSRHGKDVSTSIENWHSQLSEINKSQYKATLEGALERLKFLEGELEKMKGLPARQERFDKGYPISEMPIAREMRGERELLEKELTPVSEYSEKISDIERQMSRSVPQELSETENQLKKMRQDLLNTGFFANQETAFQRPEEKASERKKRQETAPMRETEIHQLNEYTAHENALNFDAQVRRLQEKLTGLGLDTSNHSAMMKGIEANYPNRVAELMKDWENMNKYRGMRNKFRDYVRLVKQRNTLVAEQRGLETDRRNKKLEQEVKTIIHGVKNMMEQMGRRSRSEAEMIPSELDDIKTMKEAALKVASVLKNWISKARTDHEREAIRNRMNKVNDWISNL